jgi:hypothetical protein
MRFHSMGLVAACLVSPLLSACSDDGTDGLSTNPSQASVGTNPTGAMTTSGQPTDGTGTPTTSAAGTDSAGTDSGATDSAGTTAEPSTGAATATTTADPSSSSTGDGTTGEPGTGTSTTDTTGAPPPMCTDAECPVGQFCNMGTGTCDPGCNEDADCMGMTVCDVGSNTCKGCITDANCALGTVCEAGNCVPGCNDNQPCQDGLACCAGACFDLLVDPLHCGSCDACAVPANAAAACTMGSCGLGACEDGFNDCDKDPANGCEKEGTCKCVPGAQTACYTGPPETQNKGKCKDGVQTCNAQGTGYGACVGEILPGQTDICANNVDDNCDGVVDENPDEDKDGWTVCGGDCCDAIGPNCLNPELVNPGAFDLVGNMVDDDCDNMLDNVVPACDGALATNSNTGNDYAKAIDLCQFTTENPPLAQKKWGVISTTITRADGVGASAANAKSIRNNFGTGGIVPQKNARLAVFSTGNAADQGDVSPPYADFEGGTDNGANSNAPADWLAANGNQFPNAPGCPGPGSTTAYNSIMMKIRVRVPTNAKSFNVQMHFFSAEWPEYVCTNFNDLFVSLVTSTAVGNPADKNIAIYTTQQNQKYPVGVNIAKAAAGLFTECKNGQVACLGAPFNYNNCSAGVNPLAGTGFQVTNDAGCGANNTTGGGTGWLKMAGNVKGGETMEIRFAIWDTGDGVWDSLVLLDDWEWSVQASQPGVQPN